MKDYTGYRILPHPDIETKIVTTLIYIARDEKWQGLGTTIFRAPKEPFCTVSYLPNHACSFAVSESSWHAREALPDRVETRDLLSFVYFKEGADPAFSYL